MINIPYIPYIVFSLFMIVGIYLGYKKGFKIAIYATILSASAFMFAYLLFFFLYPMLASLFSNLIYDNLGDSSYSWDEVLELGKPIIFNIAMSIFFLPLFFFLWIASYPIYKKLNKANYDKVVKKISSNEVEIVKVKNTKNKLGGLALGSISSLVFASIVTSAFSAVFVSSSSYSSFLSITDGLTRIISGGYIGSSDSYHYLVDYLPYTKNSELMQSVSLLINPNKDNLISDEQIKLIEEKKHLHIFKNILNDASSTNALFKTISQKNTLEKWNPFDETLDSNSLLINIGKTMDKFNIALSSTQKNNLWNYVASNSIINFKETSPYINWFDAELVLKQAKEELVSRNSALSAIRQEVETEINKTIADINEAKSLMQEYNDNKNINIPKYKNDADAKEIIKDQEQDEANRLKIIKEADQVEYNQALNDFNQKNDELNLKINRKSNLEKENSNLQNDIKNLNLDIENLRNRIVDLEDNLIPKLETNLEKERNTLQDKESALSLALKDKQQKETNLNDAKEDHDTKTIELSNKESLYEDAKEITNNLKSIWDLDKESATKEQDYLDALAEENLAKAARDNAKKNLDDSTITLNIKQSEFNLASTNYDSKESERDKVLNSINKIETDLLNLENELLQKNNSRIEKNNSKAEKETKIRNNKIEITTINNEINTLTPIVYNLEKIKNDKENIYRASNKAYTDQQKNADEALAIYESANNLHLNTISRNNEINTNLLPSKRILNNDQVENIKSLYAREKTLIWETQVLNVTTKNIDASFSGGNENDWQITLSSIDKNISASGQYKDSIPYQEELIITLTNDEASLRKIRDQKQIEFSSYIETLKGFYMKL